jgi:hypothetical protein
MLTEGAAENGLVVPLLYVNLCFFGVNMLYVVPGPISEAFPISTWFVK